MWAGAETAAGAPGAAAEARAVGAVLDAVRVALATVTRALEPGSRSLAASGAVTNKRVASSAVGVPRVPVISIGRAGATPARPRRDTLLKEVGASPSEAHHAPEVDQVRAAAHARVGVDDPSAVNHPTAGSSGERKPVTREKIAVRGERNIATGAGAARRVVSLALRMAAAGGVPLLVRAGRGRAPVGPPDRATGAAGAGAREIAGAGRARAAASACVVVRAGGRSATVVVARGAAASLD